MGLDVTWSEEGCCGMAGSFGFEAGEHDDVSMKLGEMALLPAVRKAPPEALVIADGFSCMEQIVQGTPRRPMHLAQVLRMQGLRGGVQAVEPVAPRRAELQRPQLRQHQPPVSHNLAAATRPSRRDASARRSQHWPSPPARLC
jgi:hypothetical protein